MALDIAGIEANTLESFVGEPTGLASFLDAARDAQVWTF